MGLVTFENLVSGATTNKYPFSGCPLSSGNSTRTKSIRDGSKGAMNNLMYYGLLGDRFRSSVVSIPWRSPKNSVWIYLGPVTGPRWSNISTGAHDSWRSTQSTTDGISFLPVSGAVIKYKTPSFSTGPWTAKRSYLVEPQFKLVAWSLSKRKDTSGNSLGCTMGEIMEQWTSVEIHS